ncbi:metallophosphoesterase [Micromonospora sp. DT233]|uniref:metallophosphoesterase n=1 Tax=Micromonospora sp. DT233 TaxID=3393432 RepID=UPI003CF8C914
MPIANEGRRVPRRALLLGTAGALTTPLLGSSLLADPARAAGSPSVAGGLSKESFSIVVLPDTQYAVRGFPASFTKQIEWINANRDSSYNIRYVIHVGDVVNNSDDAGQWEFGRTGMNSLLAGGVPYTIAVGNHDVTGAEDSRNFSQFNTHFPYSRFATLQTAGGSFPANTYTTNWHRFSAGGTDWGIISLAWDPSAAEMNWAGGIIEANPNVQFIINVHSYLRASTGDMSPIGVKLWNGLAKLHPNIVMVTCGHTGGHSRHLPQTGVNGNTVHGLLTDFQDPEDPVANSYLRIMTFRPATGKVEMRTYSPRYERWLTDKFNQFTISGFPFKPGVPRVRRWIPDPTVRDAWGLTPADRWDLPVAECDKYPQAADLPATPRLIRVAGTSPVFVRDGAQKRRVVNPRSSAAWRLSEAAVREITQAQADAIPTGPTWPAYPYMVGAIGLGAAYILDTQ